jgi:hypothetical protein
LRVEQFERGDDITCGPYGRIRLEVEQFERGHGITSGLYERRRPEGITT